MSIANQQDPQQSLRTHLVEAGLLTEDQVNVILADQVTTAMSFGEIAVCRGWIKEQTVEYVIQKVILPGAKAAASVTAEREALRQERAILRREKDTLRQERETLRREKDTLRREKDTLRQAKETLRQQRDADLQSGLTSASRPRQEAKPSSSADDDDSVSWIG